jgi:phospholipase/carboxylesterase
MSETLIILLHGVGSRGADLAPLGDHWQTVFPGLQTVSPDAPFLSTAAAMGGNGSASRV